MASKSDCYLKERSLFWLCIVVLLSYFNNFTYFVVNFVCLSVSQSFIHNCHPSRHSIVARLFSCGRKVPPLFRPADYGIWFLLVPQAAFAFKWQTGNGFCQSKKDARLSNSMVEGRRLSISRPEYTTATNREGKKRGSYKIAADWRCHTKDPLSGATAIL